MNLLHYTSEPIEQLRSVDQRGPGNQLRGDKPQGLWLSVEGEDDWLNWCKAKDCGDPASQICYEVTLVTGANVLHLSTSEEIQKFTAEYCARPKRVMVEEVRTGFLDEYLVDPEGIRWDLVAEAYAGIIIAPYQWSCRLTSETMWYYGWDCASGCIWSADAVLGIEEVGHV